MSLILDGTNGVSDIDGTAATPAIRGTDTNTGIFFPAADTIAFSEGGAEVARFDNAGNLLVGGTTQRLNAKITNNGAYWSGSGNSSGDAEYFLSNYATPTCAWTMSVRQDVGGANNDLKFLRLNSSGAFQDIAMQITQASGNLLFNSGYGSAAVAYGCRAWVNFNGTGTVAIRGSGNVSSISDNGTGTYAVNYTTSLVDGNYSAVATANEPFGAMRIACTTGNSTTNAIVYTFNGAGTLSDVDVLNYAVFR